MQTPYDSNIHKLQRVSLSDEGQVVIIANPYIVESRFGSGSSNAKLLVAVYARNDIKIIEGTLQ